MTVLALIGIKEALNIIALRVSLMIDYSVLTDRQINHIKVWTHTTRLPPFFHQLFFALMECRLFQASMHLCVGGNDFPSFYKFSSRVFNCPNSVNFIMLSLSLSLQYQYISHD